MNFSSEKLDDNESSLDQPSANGEKEKIIEDNTGKENIRKSLRDDKKKIQLEIKERTFELRWENNASD